MSRRTRIEYSATPRVDLLPAAQRAERHHQQTLPKLLLALVASAAAAGLIWAAGLIPTNLADAELHAAEERSTELIAQIGALADVQSLVRDSATLSEARAQLTLREVLFAPLLDDTVGALVEGVALVGFTGALVPADGSAAVIGASGGEIDLHPLCVAETATLTVKLESDDLGLVAGVLGSLQDMDGVDCLVMTVVEELGTARVVTAQYAVNDARLASRFADDGDEGE